MNTRKPRVFLASVFKGLNEERQALVKLFEKHTDKDFIGYENWIGGGAPARESRIRAKESDYLILVIGRRYGTRDPGTTKAITQLEYEDFLYTHTKECSKSGDLQALYVFEKYPDSIRPGEADTPGDDRIALSRFTDRVKRRHTCKPFKDWRELQQKVDQVLKLLPSSVPDAEYRKICVGQFDFRVFNTGKIKEEKVETRWSVCPCRLYENGGCEFRKSLHYRPPACLRVEMKRHLDELFSDPTTNPEWKKNKPSFKTVNIRERNNKVLLEFCHSTWLQFLGTNLAATKDQVIKKLLMNAPDEGCNIELSPFSSNLGFTVAVIDKDNERLYYSIRKNVAVYSGLKGLAVGTQLHAYDRDHKYPDGTPDIFSAIYKELYNEAGLSKSDIQELYLVAWGVGTRTGVPEFIFVCETNKELSKILQDVYEARVAHYSEYDRFGMRSEENICLDYELLAQLDEHPEQWEPESAVACCLALDQLVKGCVSFPKL